MNLSNRSHTVFALAALCGGFTLLQAEEPAKPAAPAAPAAVKPVEGPALLPEQKEQIAKWVGKFAEPDARKREEAQKEFETWLERKDLPKAEVEQLLKEHKDRCRNDAEVGARIDQLLAKLDPPPAPPQRNPQQRGQMQMRGVMKIQGGQAK